MIKALCKYKAFRKPINSQLKNINKFLLSTTAITYNKVTRLQCLDSSSGNFNWCKITLSYLLKRTLLILNWEEMESGLIRPQEELQNMLPSQTNNLSSNETFTSVSSRINSNLTT